MKKIKTYNNFINESLKDKLKGKSDEEILNNVKKLTPLKKLEKGAEYGILPLVKQGIEEGADPSSSDNYVISLASEKGHLDVVKELLKDKRVDPSDYSNEAIRAASEKGHLDIVKELLKDKRVDPSDYDNYAIRFASSYGNLDVVKELMKDKRVDPSDNDNEPIRYASEQGHFDIVKELLKDVRVRNKLSIEKLNKYKKQVSNLNESLRDKLKGKSESEIYNSIINKKLSEITDSLYNIYKRNAPTELIHKIADKYDIPKFNKITIIDILDAMSYIKKYKEGPYDDIIVEYRSSYIKPYKLNSIDNKYTYVIRIHIGSGYNSSWTDIRVLPEEEKEVLEYLNDMIKKYN